MAWLKIFAVYSTKDYLKPLLTSGKWKECGYVVIHGCTKKFVDRIGTTTLKCRVQLTGQIEIAWLLCSILSGNCWY
jgi:hypothetical protein